MIISDRVNTTEVAIDMTIHELISATNFLNEKRLINSARRFIIANASDIELVRDRLSRILDDVGGK